MTGGHSAIHAFFLFWGSHSGKSRWLDKNLEKVPVIVIVVVAAAATAAEQEWWHLSVICLQWFTCMLNHCVWSGISKCQMILYSSGSALTLFRLLSISHKSWIRTAWYQLIFMILNGMVCLLVSGVARALMTGLITSTRLGVLVGVLEKIFQTCSAPIRSRQTRQSQLNLTALLFACSLTLAPGYCQILFHNPCIIHAFILFSKQRSHN